MSSSSLSTEQLQIFYSADRSLFKRLVRVLGLDSSIANRVMAFWLWLEENGYQSMNEEIQRRSLSDNIINALAGEALEILALIDGETLPENVSNENFPATFIILEEHVSIGTLYEARVSVRHGIAKQLLDVCSRTFGADDEANLSHGNDDVGGNQILPHMTEVQPVAERPVTERRNIVHQRPHVISQDFPFALRGLRPGFGFHPANQFRSVQPFPIRMRPIQPMVVPPPRLVPIIPRAQSFHAMPRHERSGGFANMLSVRPRFPTGGQSNMAGFSRIQPVNPPPFVTEVAVPVPRNAERSRSLEDRALFATFSKGYAVSIDELGEHLDRTYGNIVECIDMEHTVPSVQPLFARVVLRSPENVEEVLAGSERVKLKIHGKHVYVRKHVSSRKHGSSRKFFVKKN